MGESEPDYASAAAVAGLAGEVEQLRRRLEPVETLPDRVQQLADVVDGLADKVAHLSQRGQSTAVPSWLMAPADADTAGELLDELTSWMQQVFLRYADAAAVLPECWAWHPDVIEELLWLMHAWLNAYQGQAASISLVGDWHDRYRPGVVKRIKQTAGTCSLENHTPATEPPAVPLPEARDDIAEWWGSDRDNPPPEPTEPQLAATAPRRRQGGMRR